jgi:hypothetical protein
MPKPSDRDPPGRAAVVVSIVDAQRDLAKQRRRRADPPAAEPRGDAKIKPGKWSANNLGLPAEKGCECPVIPLGFEGALYHLIDSSGQFRSLAPSDFSHAGIQSLFAGCPNYPQWAWPRYGRAPATKEGEAPKPAPIKSFEDDAVRQALFRACDRKGMFSPTDKLRGRGSWMLRGGGLVYHAGEDLWIWDGGRMKTLETGLLEGHLYARYPALPSPWTETITAADNPAGAVLETLRKWNWERPDVDPLLMLGWIGVAYLGGALEWRSAVLLLGDKATGKSTLQQGLKDLFGEALFHSADTSAAGIYQKMAHDTRPVAVDELEPGAEQKKVDAVVELMRAASSGAIARRGGQTGTPTEYQMRSAFLFSAINNPLHASQDLSRVAVLRLKQLDPNLPRPDPIDADTCGRKVLAVVMREWPRFAATREAYRDALKAGGHVARGQDTYGTLLAAADLLLGPELAEKHGVVLSEDLAWWSEHLAADKLPEIEDTKANWRACLEHLLTAQVEAWRNGARQTIGKALDDISGISPFAQAEKTYTIEDAERDLALTGLGLIRPGAKLDIGEGIVLAIPNDGPQVAKLFAGKPWASGGWKDALRQCPVPGVVISDRELNRVKIGGVRQRCTLVVMARYHDAPEG